MDNPNGSGQSTGKSSAAEVGRAACRERGEISGGGGSFKKKKKESLCGARPSADKKTNRGHSPFSALSGQRCDIPRAPQYASYFRRGLSATSSKCFRCWSL